MSQLSKKGPRSFEERKKLKVTLLFGMNSPCFRVFVPRKSSLDFMSANETNTKVKIDPLIAKHGSSKPATENRARGIRHFDLGILFNPLASVWNPGKV